MALALFGVRWKARVAAAAVVGLIGVAHLTLVLALLRVDKGVQEDERQ